MVLDIDVAATLDVSVVMPCLNEARTIVTCIEKAHAALRNSGLSYEIVVGDNGSTDGSQRGGAATKRKQAARLNEAWAAFRNLAPCPALTPRPLGVGHF